jgi:hypothetical protein
MTAVFSLATLAFGEFDFTILATELSHLLDGWVRL